MHASATRTAHSKSSPNVNRQPPQGRSFGMATGVYTPYGVKSLFSGERFPGAYTTEEGSGHGGPNMPNMQNSPLLPAHVIQRTKFNPAADSKNNTTLMRLPSWYAQRMQEANAFHSCSSMISGWQPLRRAAEKAGNVDLSDVRLHYPSKECGRYDAAAFTCGTQIHIAAGREGSLPHELWHAVQQRQGRVQPTSTVEGALLNDAPALEKEADLMGETTVRKASQSLSFVRHDVASAGTMQNVMQRQLSPVLCSPARMVSVNADSLRARTMLIRSSINLARYSATGSPAHVATAMNTHFHTTSRVIASVLGALAMQLLVRAGTQATTTGYVCGTDGVYPCSNRGIGAWAAWCIPGIPIVLCPVYFTQTPAKRSLTLIHEWMHKYFCSLDIGYEGSSEYPSHTFTAFLNADNFENLIRDTQ